MTQLPADGYGDWGGPLGGGFMATGTNMTYSTAANWTRTLSNTFLMEVRGGTSYYHNEALTTANGQNLAEQVGIKGVNLDEWTSGPTTININNGYSNPALGYVGSLPWDRWERTWEISTTLTKVLNNHTIKFGGNYRRNSDKLLQTQDNQGPRGGFTFSGAQTGSTADTAANSGIANSLASFLLDLPSGMARDLKVLEDVGSQHWAVYSFVQDKWQVSPRMTVDLGVRWEYYDPIVGLSGKGSLSNFDPATNSLLVSGFGNIADDFGHPEGPQQLQPAAGRDVPPRRQDRPARRFRRQHHAVPRQLGTRSTTRSSRTTATRRPTRMRRRRSTWPRASRRRRSCRSRTTGSSTPTRCWGSRSSTCPTTSSRGPSTRGTSRSSGKSRGA